MHQWQNSSCCRTERAPRPDRRTCDSADCGVAYLELAGERSGCQTGHTFSVGTRLTLRTEVTSSLTVMANSTIADSSGRTQAVATATSELAAPSACAGRKGADPASRGAAAHFETRAPSVGPLAPGSLLCVAGVEIPRPTRLGLLPTGEGVSGGPHFELCPTDEAKDVGRPSGPGSEVLPLPFAAPPRFGSYTCTAML